MDDDPKFKSEDVTQVDVFPLDDLLEGRAPVLLKVDVEGFEQEVIRGAESTLLSSNLQAVIIELFGHENRYGFSYENVHKDLLRYGYAPYEYFPFERQLQRMDSFNHNKFNTIYVRNLEWVHGRVGQADPVKVLNQLIEIIKNEIE